MVSIDRAAVTFDLWNTLIFEFDNKLNSTKRRELRTEYSLDALRGLGESLEWVKFHETFGDLAEEITAGHDAGTDSHFHKWIYLGLSRIDRDLPERIGDSGVADVASAIDKAFLDCPPLLLEGSLEILDQIRRRGLLVGLITNTGMTSSGAFTAWFAELGLLPVFDHMVFSNDLAIAKPNHLIFDVTLEALEVIARRVIHVGDNIHTDVAGAAAAGITTVWVSGSAQTDLTFAVKPDFTLQTILELLPIVDRWLESLDR